MGGFLTAYDDTTKVPIGDPERGYWVEVRQYVSQGDKEGAERALMTVVVVDGSAEPKPDVARYRQLMALASIKSWNLDDEDGTVWPVDIDHVKMIPGEEFTVLWGVIDKLNKPMPSVERRQFLASSVSSNTNGNHGAS
jgi:hypothetical protein